MMSKDINPGDLHCKTAFNHFTTLPYRQKHYEQCKVLSGFGALHFTIAFCTAYNNIKQISMKPGAVHTTERLDPWTQVP